MKTILKIDEVHSVKTFNGLIFICIKKPNNTVSSEVFYVNEGELAEKLFNMGYNEETITSVINKTKNNNEFKENDDSIFNRDILVIRNEILNNPDGIIEVLIDYDSQKKESFINIQSKYEFLTNKINPLSVLIYFKNIEGLVYLTIYEDNEGKLYDIETLNSPFKWINPVYRIIRILSDVCDKCNGSISNYTYSFISKSLIEKMSEM